MTRKPLQEVVEENEEVFRAIANSDDLPAWFRRKYGEQVLDLLDEGRSSPSSKFEGEG